VKYVLYPLLAVAAGCGAADPVSSAGGAPPPTNRIHVPPEVVGNLGITFRKAEQGRLEIRKDIPGRLEVPEDRHWKLRAPAPGRIRGIKGRWSEVRAGERIGELVSDELRAAQDALYESRNDLLEAERDLEQARAAAAPRKDLAATLLSSVEAARQRVQGSAALVQTADEVCVAARRRLAEVRRLRDENSISDREFLAAQVESLESEAAALDAQRRVQEARIALGELELRAAEAQADVTSSGKLLETIENRRRSAQLAHGHKARALATLVGMPGGDLGDGWEKVEAIPLVAPADGVIADLHVAGGEWVEASTVLAEIVDTSVLVFRGDVPEGDLRRFPAGAPVKVISPVGAFEPVESVLRGPLAVADPHSRTVRVEATVPNADRRLPRGVSALALVLVDRAEHEEVLAGVDCVVQDQLEFIVFRRDPADPEYVIRTPIAIGRRTRDTVEILSGVGAGDELVRDGIHQLKQTGIGRPSAKGHFHADGTWHEGDK